MSNKGVDARKEAAAKAQEKDVAKIRKGIADLKKIAASAKKGDNVHRDALKIKNAYANEFNNLELKFFDISRFNDDKKDYTKDEVKNIIASFDVTKLAERFDQDARMIDKAVESNNNTELKYYVQLMQESIVNNNYPHAAALFNGLLNNEQNIQDKEIKKVIRKLEESKYFSPQGSYKVYKVDLADAKGMFIPSVSTVAKDLVGITDKLKDEVETLNSADSSAEEKEEARDVLKYFAELWNREMKKMTDLQRRADKKVDEKTFLSIASEITSKMEEKKAKAQETTAVKSEPVVAQTSTTEATSTVVAQPSTTEATSTVVAQPSTTEATSTVVAQNQAPKAQTRKRPNVRPDNTKEALDPLKKINPGKTIPKNETAEEAKQKPAKPVVPPLDLEKVPKAAKDTRKVAPEIVEDIRVLEGVPKQKAPTGTMLHQEAEKISRSAAVTKSQEAQRREAKGTEEKNQGQKSVVARLTEKFEHWVSGNKHEELESQQVQAQSVAKLVNFFENPLDLGTSSGKNQYVAREKSPQAITTAQRLAASNSDNPLYLAKKDSEPAQPKQENDEKKTKGKSLGH